MSHEFFKTLESCWAIINVWSYIQSAVNPTLCHLLFINNERAEERIYALKKYNAT